MSNSDESHVRIPYGIAGLFAGATPTYVRTDLTNEESTYVRDRSYESNAREMDEGSFVDGGEPDPLAALPVISDGPLRFPVIRSGERAPIPRELRYAIAYRDKYKCQWCANRTDLQLDHLIPWSAGGADSDVNLRLLCGPCNKRRSNFHTDEHWADVYALTFQCIRCEEGEPDSTVTDAFCLLCGRLGATRADQLRMTRRYRWETEISWSGWKWRLQTARKEGRWIFWTAKTDQWNAS